MMTGCEPLAERLTSALALTKMPVGIAFTNTTPADHTRPDRAAAAGCKFWELGAVDALVTDASDHRHCSIGIHTHNLTGAPRTQAKDLGDTLAAMQGLDYVRPEEAAALPVLNTENAFVTYTPLARCANEPAVVLLFADARQGLVLTEAIARVDKASPAALGRPACAVVPAVVSSERAASSLGCCGARAYLDQFSDEMTIWALPGNRLEAYVEAIETMGAANDTLRRFHELRATDIAAGEQPSVETSLARLHD